MNEIVNKLFSGDSRYIYQNELDKACFQHDMAYRDFKDLNRSTFSDKVLRDRKFNIAKDPKYDGYQRGLTSIVYKFLIKKLLVLVLKTKIVLNTELEEELHKPIIKNFL